MDGDNSAWSSPLHATLCFLLPETCPFEERLDILLTSGREGFIPHDPKAGVTPVIGKKEIDIFGAPTVYLSLS